MDPIKPFERIEFKFSELEARMSMSATVNQLKELEARVKKLEMKR